MGFWQKIVQRWGVGSSNAPDLNTYQQVFNASPDYISISRLADGRYMEVNPGYETFTGYQRHEVVGRTSTELGIWPSAEVRDNFVAALNKEGQLHGYGTSLRNRAGSVRFVEVSATTTIIDGVEVLVAIVRDITERKRIDDELAAYRAHLEHMVEQRTAELQHLAEHDALTGLPNRALLNDRMAQAIHLARRNQTSVAFMMIDLDGFKRVNDSFGHAIGDGLLRQVADRLSGAIRKTDTVARIGGDEFMLLIAYDKQRADVDTVAAKVLSLLRQTFVIESRDIRIDGSIGIAICPEHGTLAPGLMRAADAAMYRAKVSESDNICFAESSACPSAPSRPVPAD